MKTKGTGLFVFGIEVPESMLKPGPTVMDDINKLIASELQNQKEEIVEMIRGMMENEKGQYGKGMQGEMWDAYDDGYNVACDDIIKKIGEK